ncbi:MAG: SNF2-related protein [Terriglobia bacterium]
MSTPFHTKYWAHELTLRSATGSIEALSRSIAGARVDLNPHQVDAALFALRSPLAKGVILADEVGLGKTIEASIVLAQRWAERRRRILLIVPAILRKQWQQELETKFYLPAIVLDSRIHANMVEQGNADPFATADRIIICSYHFASARAQEISRVPWDLVVIDEAHRLRNVFRSSSHMARNIVDAVAGSQKLLITATPLQNSLMELYGLTSVIDDHIFGDAASFRDQFVRAADEDLRNTLLQDRLRPICIRTLRRQVGEYIPFTRRVPVTQEFHPSDEEQALYDRVSAYLQRGDLVALPSRQRKLITLILRKLLASSTFAIANTLSRMIDRLADLDAQLDELFDDEDIEGLDELEDEMAEDDEARTDAAAPSSDTDSAAAAGTAPTGVGPTPTFATVTPGTPDPAASAASPDPGPNPSLDYDPDRDDPRPLEVSPPFTPEQLKAELIELRDYLGHAKKITSNAKGDALIPALKVAFEKAESLGAQRKAVIFTESRRTQDYLFALLTANGYAGQVVNINGSNHDPHSRSIYHQWRERHAGQEIITGSEAVDVKAAIVEQFEHHASILVATEAAAEGINLQFCSLVVNFDLPWNPQRVEQRIGRCHRYGQKHDVVVVNFSNLRNEADQRVLELLGEKFRLFNGVFGVSDEVLGALESGVDIERRIAAVYQTSRTGDEIKAAFDKLQADLDVQIQARMTQTRQTLLEHFDQDVSNRLRVHRDKTMESLNQRERFLLELTRAELDGDARFADGTPRFEYTGGVAAAGWYHFDWKQAEKLGDTFYRQDHPLAARIIETAITRETPPQAVTLNYTAHGQTISVLKPYVGATGWLAVSKLSIQSLDTEEFLLFAGMTDGGEVLDEEICRKLLLLPAEVTGASDGAAPTEALVVLQGAEQAKKIKLVEERNGKFFDEEVLKLDHWSEDLKQGLERELKDLDKQIKEARRASALAGALEAKLAAQKQMKALCDQRTAKRRALYDEQDTIDAKREDLIAQIEQQLEQKQVVTMVFAVRWRIQ